ncbi:MAG TPA: UDP-N-acetylmuramate dehydrogenase [Accumulibacter sp.]|nr:UDP-N-acetylmuramate dehydrogenase [Accumulibacter sp.]HMW16718.1 UDP-N-acetylmuramate dehydrogenase [Accumulibacter sp.]HNC18161.1 UDP-N-acetylmuramate dehydrogenase [Accumulibacter sp.]HND79770.1 UDP-N-acetylmuramate dehydrogenase [Accumulibacter sp.]HNE12130.1 UDP-N-acetylmuramate dehydrogenase [Accumulibacter sp.]
MIGAPVREVPLPDFVERNADLTAKTTLGLPGRAALLATVRSVDQLQQLRALATDGRRCFILGSGSNVVLSGDFDGLVLQPVLTGRQLIGEDADAWYVRAAAGESWHELVMWTLAQGWPGLENLSLIPGTVGAAPVQNIGAYGLEIADRFLSLETFDLITGQQWRLDHAACRFAYRDSVFKQQGWNLEGRRVITGITLRLPKRWQPLTGYTDLAGELDRQQISAPTPQQVAEAVMAVRQSKLPDPARLPNAGSFFQNPVVPTTDAERLAQTYPSLPRYPQRDGHVKLAAAWLIEHSGWKGRNLGPVGMYEKQALVLVNRGGARGTDVIALTRAVQASVRQRFGVELTPEPVTL